MLSIRAIISLLCFVCMVYAASFSSGGYNEYVYKYKVGVLSGPQGFIFETKASLEILYSLQEAVLVRLSLHEPRFLQSPDPTSANIIKDLYAHLIVSSNGSTIVKDIFTHKDDTTTFKNIKKSILLNLLPTSHHLQTSSSPTTITETTTKPLFIHDNQKEQPELFSPDSISHVHIVAWPLRDASSNSNQQQALPTVYKTVEGEQNVTFRSRIFAQAESNLTTKFELELVDQLKSDEAGKYDQADSIAAALKFIDSQTYQSDTIQLERERKICSTHRCDKTLAQLYKDYQDSLTDDAMATVDASIAFLRLLERLRNSQTTGLSDISNLLRKNRRGEDSSTFLDILAAARTKDSIQAAMKHLKLTKVIDRDLAVPERFLSVLSVAAKTASKMHLKRPLTSPYYFTPSPSLRRSVEAKQQSARVASLEFIAKEFLHLFEQVPAQKWGSQKLRWSSLLTLATLVNANNHENEYKNLDDDLNNRVNKLLLNELSSCDRSQTDCRIVAMQSIGNVGHLGRKQFQALKNQVFEFGRRESNTAMKILLDLLQKRAKDNPLDSTIQNDLKDFLRRVVYDDTQETTSRVLAAEMIVRFVPNSINIDEMLQNLPLFNNNELATMIYSRIQSLRPESIKKHHDWYWKSCIINGTSQSFIKTMARTDSLNASYGVNLELLNSGKVLRESSFDVLLDTKQRTQDLFSLGVFARGFEQLADGDMSRILGAFFGGGSSNNEEGESETAGMSLKLLGGYLRPYVFFNNLKELVGHYNRGTASQHPVTAFNGNLMLIDHDEGYPLVTGFVAEQQMRGVLSIDVSGQIEVSVLWNRKAHSVVATKASTIVQASQSVYTSIDKLWMSHLFSFGGQAEIDFMADAFFNDMPAKACLRVTQPEFKVRYHSRRHDQMLTNEIRRKVTRENFSVGAKSYSMNSENDQMCSYLFADL